MKIYQQVKKIITVIKINNWDWKSRSIWIFITKIRFITKMTKSGTDYSGEGQENICWYTSWLFLKVLCRVTWCVDIKINIINQTFWTFLCWIIIWAIVFSAWAFNSFDVTSQQFHTLVFHFSSGLIRFLD